MGCAITRSKAATAMPEWSRATARICWLCDCDGFCRRRRFGTRALLSGRRIGLRVVGPDVAFPEHAGAAAGIFGAPMIGIEAGYNRGLTPRFAAAHHYAGAG